MHRAYLNPHLIKPGEILSKQLLFERYLGWKAHINSVNAVAITEYCVPSLWSNHLCCDDHFLLQAELGVFVRHFTHQKMMTSRDIFTDQLIKSWIKKYKLNFDVKKLALAMDMSETACAAFLKY